ncbi:hypothetical protein C0J52_23338, partial [Blattella germanica]
SELKHVSIWISPINITSSDDGYRIGGIGSIQDCMQRKLLYGMTSRKHHHSAIFHVAKSQTVQRSFGPLQACNGNFVNKQHGGGDV